MTTINNLTQYLKETKIQLKEFNTKELHLRKTNFNSIPNLYELNINYELLDDNTQSLIKPYFNSLEYYVSKNLVTINDHISLDVNKTQFTQYENLDILSEILGIDNLLIEEYEKLYQKYQTSIKQILTMLIQEISKSEIVEEYYGNKYYLYEVNYTISFSIEHEKGTIYILDYSKESDLPIIHKIKDPTSHLKQAIQEICINENELDFYITF